MYRSRSGQQSFLEGARLFSGVKLDLDNEWVKLGEAIPWDEFEDEYAAAFNGAVTGYPAKSARMALGTLLIKERYRFSNEDVIKEIQMNPYLQHFIGLTEFSHKAPFDARSISNFRKRTPPEIIAKMRGYFTVKKRGGSGKTDAKRSATPVSGIKNTCVAENGEINGLSNGTAYTTENAAADSTVNVAANAIVHTAKNAATPVFTKIKQASLLDE